MQIHDSPEDNNKLNRTLKKIAKLVSPLLWWTFWILMIEANGDQVTYGLQFIGLVALAVVTSIFIIPLAWDLGDKVRQWIKPDAFVAWDAVDGLQKKIFWLVGPQSAVALIVSLVCFAVSIGLTAPLARLQVSSSDGQTESPPRNTKAPPAEANIQPAPVVNIGQELNKSEIKQDIESQEHPKQEDNASGQNKNERSPKGQGEGETL